mmetsp:Transcript_86120/g.240828  ORF Transcript_86120/g.240828 Transcript_86120/m.240828 type:complete len:238 (+) Transcript_86120:234-947(+)
MASFARKSRYNSSQIARAGSSKCSTTLACWRCSCLSRLCNRRSNAARGSGFWTGGVARAGGVGFGAGAVLAAPLVWADAAVGLSGDDSSAAANSGQGVAYVADFSSSSPNCSGSTVSVAAVVAVVPLRPTSQSKPSSSRLAVSWKPSSASSFSPSMSSLTQLGISASSDSSPSPMSNPSNSSTSSLLSGTSSSSAAAEETPHCTITSTPEPNITSSQSSCPKLLCEASASDSTDAAV